MGEWRECKLGDVADVQNGYAFKSDKFDDFSGMPVVKIKNVASGKLDMKDVKFYQLSTKGLEKFLIRKNDILISMTGSHIHQPSSIVGKVARYDIEQNALLNQRVGKVYSKNKNELNEDYLYHFIKQETITYELASNAGGSANQANISPDLIKSLDIFLPSLPEQKAIAEVLSSLDDKIDLLHRQNKTLEAMAETFFRQWFVEPCRDSLPEGWVEGKFPDEFDFTMGQSPLGASFNENRIGIPMFQGNADFGFRFPSERVYTTEPTRFAESFDTLVSIRAPVGEQNMALSKCCIGRGVAAIRYKNNREYYTYTYFKTRSLIDEIKQFNEEGTVFGSIGKTDFEALNIYIPSHQVIKDFEKVAKPINDKIIENCKQICSLEKFRDTLLPKLMSGEVRVKEVY